MSTDVLGKDTCVQGSEHCASEVEGFDALSCNLAILQGILLASMEDGNLGRCVCPVPKCASKIPATAQQLLNIEQLERYQRLAAHCYANQNIMLQW